MHSAGIRAAAPVLTARERQVAKLIGQGMTNREIAEELGISDRTVGAHVQNILNKLGAGNRAQIATWAARSIDLGPVIPAPSPAMSAASAPVPKQRVGLLAPASLAGIVILSALLTLLFPSDHALATPNDVAALTGQRGDLVYDVKFDADMHEFTMRYTLGDATASSVKIVNGAIEYSILKAGGNTGNSLALPPMQAYFAEYSLSVRPDSSIVFWLGFSNDDASINGSHLLSVDTAIETMQMIYFTGNRQPELPLGPQVSVGGMQAGRQFAIATLVNPPEYAVFLDGVRVIDVKHSSPKAHLVPAFAIFGGGTGTVRLSAIRLYRVV